MGIQTSTKFRVELIHKHPYFQRKKSISALFFVIFSRRWLFLTSSQYASQQPPSTRNAVVPPRIPKHLMLAPGVLRGRFSHFSEKDRVVGGLQRHATRQRHCCGYCDNIFTYFFLKISIGWSNYVEQLQNFNIEVFLFTLK